MRLHSRAATAPPIRCALAIIVYVSVVAASDGSDVLSLRDEAVPPDGDALLVPMMRDGRPVVDRPDHSLAAAQARFEFDVARLPPEARRLRDPVGPEPRVSQRLAALSASVRR